MREFDASLQLVPEGNPRQLRPMQKVAVVAVALGMLFFVVVNLGAPMALGWASLILMVGGGLIAAFDQYKDGPPGVKNHYIMFGSATARGAVGWGVGIFMTGFYVFLYFYPQYLQGLIVLVDPIKVFMSGESGIPANPADPNAWSAVASIQAKISSSSGITSCKRCEGNPPPTFRRCNSTPALRAMLAARSM